MEVGTVSVSFRYGVGFIAVPTSVSFRFRFLCGFVSVPFGTPSVSFRSPSTAGMGMLSKSSAHGNPQTREIIITFAIGQRVACVRRKK